MRSVEVDGDAGIARSQGGATVVGAEVVTPPADALHG
jgi:hypothetical protein